MRRKRRRLGVYFHNPSKDVRFALRGDLKARTDAIPTHFQAPTSVPSESRAKLNRIVPAASYPTDGLPDELLRLEPRGEFVNLFRGVARSCDDQRVTLAFGTDPFVRDQVMDVTAIGPDLIHPYSDLIARKAYG